jgi:hypothetical protein
MQLLRVIFTARATVLYIGLPAGLVVSAQA